jgi:ABC-2 type transport system ATP-binding protein
VRTNTVFDVSVANGLNKMAKEQLENHIDVMRVEEREEGEVLRVTLNQGLVDGSFLADFLIQNGFKLKMLKEEEIDLEKVFMEITKGITN